MTADSGGSAVARPAALTPFLAAVLLVVVSSVVVGVLVAGVALLAQRRWQGEYGPDLVVDGSLSVAAHALVMLLLFWLLVLVARALWGRGGGRVLAIVVALLTAFGPMSLAAAPVSAAVYPEDRVMVLWWPATLAVVMTALVIASALWTLRWFPVTSSGSWLERRRWLVGLVSLVAVYAASSATTDFWYDPGHADLAAQIQLGWMVLGAGLLTAAATTSSLGARIGMVLVAPAEIAMMFFAYNRVGGWPGVAGWEGGDSPLYSTIGVGVLICSAPLLGWAVGLIGHAIELASHGRAPQTTGSVASAA